MLISAFPGHLGDEVSEVSPVQNQTPLSDRTDLSWSVSVGSGLMSAVLESQLLIIL